jgi:hypothetical protein
VTVVFVTVVWERVVVVSVMWVSCRGGVSPKSTKAAGVVNPAASRRLV